MNPLATIEQCRWPAALPAPYDSALQQAVTFILSQFNVLGIIVAGSVLRGEGGPTSDLDIYVLNARPQRQRIQKWFGVVPAEIFVNPPAFIETYFADELKRGRPCTAHMLAGGFVVLDCDPAVEQLRARAREVLAQRPSLNKTQATLMRYLAADRLDNAADIAAQNPAGANFILNSAVAEMLHFVFLQANRFLPREKDMPGALTRLDPQLAELATRFFTIADASARLDLAYRIADLTIKARGFFEWETPLEDV